MKYFKEIGRKRYGGNDGCSDCGNKRSSDNGNCPDSLRRNNRDQQNYLHRHRKRDQKKSVGLKRSSPPHDRKGGIIICPSSSKRS
jgi:hypothetical protein